MRFELEPPIVTEDTKTLLTIKGNLMRLHEKACKGSYPVDDIVKLSEYILSLCPNALYPFDNFKTESPNRT